MRRLVWIDELDAIVLHDRLLALDGGPAGVRDEGLLQSALARPQQLAADGSSPTVIDMAATYIAGIVRNHRFFDAKKRTGFLIGVLFLELNGYRFIAAEEDAARVVLSLAAGDFDEAALADWIRANVKGE